MTLKRDARGTLRDYKRELEGELPPVFLSFFKSFEILGVAFSTASFFEPDGNFPWGGFSFFYVAYSTHSAFPVSSSEYFRVATITFWSYESKVFFAIIKPISIYMVYKSPTVFWLPYNIVMHEVIAKPSVSVITFIKLNAKKLFIIDIFIKNGVSNKLMFYVIQWGFYYIVIHNSIMYDSFIINWWNRVLVSSSHSPIMKLAETFSELRAITPWNIAYHINIISKNNKISRSING